MTIDEIENLLAGYLVNCIEIQQNEQRFLMIHLGRKKPFTLVIESPWRIVDIANDKMIAGSGDDSDYNWKDERSTTRITKAEIRFTGDIILTLSNNSEIMTFVCNSDYVTCWKLLVRNNAVFYMTPTGYYVEEKEIQTEFYGLCDASTSKC